ncbi:hypothetical protein DM02DRAFT_655196 [Periconia macrospinosa]|uniref:Uncharacterized protein n=1 Tax=Periconia macrospinosa TaxID=97972 RepID=A0A2V1DQZ0_9PLEO|nr:hypothetical protein DM02DRAFT_655196 [Periconia macrospinosa]
MHIINILVFAWIYALGLSLAAKTIPKDNIDSSNIAPVSPLIGSDSLSNACWTPTLLSRASTNTTGDNNATSLTTSQKRSISNLHSHLGGEAWHYKTKKNRVYIRYCYANPYTRNRVRCLFENAIQLWAEALGGKASEATGHAVVVSEARSTTMETLTCWEDDAYSSWTKNMPDDILVVGYDDNEETGRPAVITRMDTEEVISSRFQNIQRMALGVFKRQLRVLHTSLGMFSA